MNKKRSYLTQIGIVLLTISFLIGIITQPSVLRSVHAENGEQNAVLFLSDIDWVSASIGWGEIPNKDASSDGNTLTLTDNKKIPYLLIKE